MRYNPDNPFLQFMTTLAGFIGLNILFLITCLPVITIGPALTALYTVTMQEAREEYGYLYSTYLKTFKKVFRKSAAAFLLHLVLVLVLIYNVAFWGAQDTVTSNIFLFLVTGMLVVLVLSFLYTYPLLARFENSVKQTLKNSVLVAISNPKYTLGLLAICIVAVTLCMVVSQAKIFMVLVGFSFLAFCNSMLFIRIFRKYETETADSQAA